MPPTRQPPAPVRVLERSRFLLLLIALVAMVVILPMVPASRHAAVGVDVALIGVLIACVWSLGQRRHALLTGSLLIIPAFVAAWLTRVTDSPWISVFGLACALAFLTLTALAMLINILRRRDVVTDTILGGICVYLLFAVIFALVYEIMERVQPGSFGPWSTSSGALATPRLVSPDLIYYSVFVLSTIGPQDLHPQSGAARSWTGLEAMAGQLYLAVLIARLVSRHASQREDEPRSGT